MENLQDQIGKAWGNPKKVADALFDEVFRRMDGLDHDDQVNLGVEIGIIAGGSSSAEEALARFNSLMEEWNA